MLLSDQEICQRPKFIAEGATRFDVEQGEQGDRGEPSARRGTHRDAARSQVARRLVRSPGLMIRLLAGEDTRAASHDPGLRVGSCS
jgi:hypothetical protein